MFFLFCRKKKKLQILGINVFTLILAALIAFFMSMNAYFGPGWLGGVIFGGKSGGITGTGNFDNTPEIVDLSDSQYQ